jgi:integrase
MSDLRNYSLDELREIKELTDHIIANTIGGALDLDNLSDRVIKPISKANGLELKGWHAYRRALATNLHELGVPDIVIQAILRHEDIRTTQRSYIKTVPRVVTAAMKRLESEVACQQLYSRRHQAIW